MTKKILLISQVFYPDQVSTANLFTTLCTTLAEKNVVVEVWAAHPSYTELTRQPARLTFKGINIRYLASTNFKKNSLLGRFSNILTFMISVSFRLLFSKEKTPVWTHTTPPFLGILLSHICSFKMRKFIYIMLDIFPEGLIRLGKVSGSNIAIKVWQRFFVGSLKKSNKIVVIGRDIKQYIEEICPGCQKKIEYLPHWQDEKLISPIDFSTNKFVIENGLLEKFIVQYSGNIGLWNEVKTMGKAVKENLENIVYIFVGDGIRKEELLNEFSLEDQQNVFMMPFQNNSDFNNMLGASHVHLVTLREGLEGMAVPCKIYGILAAGRPVIAMVPELSEIAYIVSEEKCGFVINPTDLDGLIKAILTLKTNEILRNEMGKNSRNAFEKKYTTGIIAEKYLALINELG